MRCFLFLILLFACRIAFAQDTIVMYNDSIITGKVTEVSSSVIRYKRADNPDGPVYVLKCSRIKKIIYENGKEDIFNTVAERNEIFMAEKMSRHAVFAEAGGNSVDGFSFNYDYTFYRKADYGFAARGGVNAGFTINDETRYLVFPMTVSFLYGNQAALEIGAGAILASYVEYHYDNYYWLSRKVNITRLIPTGIFGFRFQKKRRLLF